MRSCDHKCRKQKHSKLHQMIILKRLFGCWYWNFFSVPGYGFISEAGLYKDIVFILVFAHSVNNRRVVFNLVHPVAICTRSAVHPFEIYSFSFLKITFIAISRQPAIGTEHCGSYPDKVNSSEDFRPGMTVLNEFTYVFPGIQQFILITGRRNCFNTAAPG